MSFTWVFWPIPGFNPSWRVLTARLAVRRVFSRLPSDLPTGARAFDTDQSRGHGGLGSHRGRGRCDAAPDARRHKEDVRLRMRLRRRLAPQGIGQEARPTGWVDLQQRVHRRRKRLTARNASRSSTGWCLTVGPPSLCRVGAERSGR